MSQNATETQQDDRTQKLRALADTWTHRGGMNAWVWRACAAELLTIVDGDAA